MGILKHKNFTEYISCDSNYKKYIETYKRLKSVVLSLENMNKNIKELIKNSEPYLIDFSIVNFDKYINDINTTDIKPIPYSLIKGFKSPDIFKPRNDKLNALDFFSEEDAEKDYLTNEASEILEELHNNYKKYIINSDKYFIELVDDITQILLPKESFNLYKEIKNYEYFIKRTQYVKYLKEFNDIKEILKKHCKNYTFKDEEILDKDIAYDIQRNKINIINLYNSKKEIISIELKNKIQVIEKNYNLYIEKIYGILDKINTSKEFDRYLELYNI